MQSVPFHQSLIAKFFALISLLLFSTVAASAWQNGYTFYQQLMFRLQEKTMQNARTTANGVDSVMESWMSQIVVIASGISGTPRSKYAEAIAPLIAANKDFITFDLLAIDDGQLNVVAAARSPYEDDERYVGQPAKAAQAKVRTLGRAWLSDLAKLHDDSVAVRNLSADADLPVLAMALSFPVKDSKTKLWALLTVWQTKLFAALSKGLLEQALVVDKQGRVVSASEPKRLSAKEDLRNYPTFVEATKNEVPFGFKDWTNDSDEKILGAFARIPKYDLVALTESDGQPAYDAVRKVVTKSLLWAAFFVLVSMVMSYLSARGLTRSLRRLIDATVKIAGGDFKTRTVVKSRDEIGMLSIAVNHMSTQIESLMNSKVEVARLETELKTAKMVQDEFFPQGDFEQDPMFKVSSHFQPASECGGDWWGHYRLTDRYHMVVIADATGHGVSAALVTAMVFAATSILARQLTQREEIAGAAGFLLGELNRTLCSSRSGKHTMTVFAAIVDMDTGAVTYSNGGHNFPMIVRKDPENARNPKRLRRGKRREMMQLQNTPLGIDLNAAYDERQVQMDPGDKLLLYTDGLFECSNAAGEAWGKGRFLRLVEDSADWPVDKFKEELVDGAYSHFAGHPLDDDVTVVVVELSLDWSPKSSFDDLDFAADV